MMQQLSFDALPSHMHSIRSRTTDPDSSHIAEAKLKRTGKMQRQRDIVWEELWKRRDRWITSAELADESGLDRHMVARRLPELREEFRAVQLIDPETNKPHMRICRVNGGKAMVWKVDGTA